MMQLKPRRAVALSSSSQAQCDDAEDTRTKRDDDDDDDNIRKEKWCDGHPEKFSYSGHPTNDLPQKGKTSQENSFDLFKKVITRKSFLIRGRW